MVSDENLRLIRDITEILEVYFTGDTDKEAEKFIAKYEPIANDLLDVSYSAESIKIYN